MSQQLNLPVGCNESIVTFGAFEDVLAVETDPMSRVLTANLVFRFPSSMSTVAFRFACAIFSASEDLGLPMLMQFV